jgi:hypothetical protein
MVKCNPTSKQCEPCAAGSSADCKYTPAQCDAVCAVPHAKCNYNTSKCEPCAFGLDPNCTMTMGSCQAPGVCAGNTFGLCNVTTGKCDKCDPNQQKGCVAKCQDTCTKKPTPPPTPKPHPPSPKPTPKPTPPPKPTFFSCDWTAQPPKCREDPSATTTQQECSTQCASATFAKCNTTTYKCDACTQGSDPDCKLTKAVCAAGCKKPDHNSTTVYRGNEISSNFARGEWDFTFYPDNKLGIGYLDGKGGVFKWEGTLGGHFAVGAGPSQSIMLTLTEVPAAAGAPFAAKVGDQLSGIYEDKAGYYQVTDFKYLAFSMPGGTTPADMDAGMSGNMEFVLVKCHETGKSCDFTGAEVPE